MSAFDAANDARFADPNLARDATYTPAAGAPIAVRVIKVTPQVSDRQFLQMGFQLSPASQAAAAHAVVRRSEVAEPAKGDTITIDGLTYPVRDIGDLDPLGLNWPLTLGKPS